MKRARPFFWLVAVALAAAVLSLYRPKPLPTGNHTVTVLEVAAGCDPTTTSCEAKGEVGAFSVKFGPGLTPLVPFPLEVRVGEGMGEVRAVIVELTMTGMDMGLNRYRLSQTGSGVWTGKVTLPVCTSGRLDWVATVSLDGEQRRWQARFPFRSGG
jgi:hypothetical protein